MAKTRQAKSASKAHASQRNFDYPTETEGSRIARQLRSEANGLTESEREELFKQGMQVIYGGSGNKEKVGRR